jgi:hypothetical protein
MTSTMSTGEFFQERSKGKDVRTSNIIAAKVRFSREEKSVTYRPFKFKLVTHCCFLSLSHLLVYVSLIQ